MKEHVSVLLNESIEGLDIKSDGIYVDATLGRAGHSYHILNKLSNLGKLHITSGCVRMRVCVCTCVCVCVS